VTIYKAPTRDMAFVLKHVCHFDDILASGHFDGIETDMVMGALEEFGRFSADVMAPLNTIGDEVGSHCDAQGNVTSPDGFKEAYEQYVQSGFGAAAFEPTYGGGGFPWVANMGLQEILNSSNLSMAICCLLTQGAIDALMHHGSEEQREMYLPKMVTGEWSGTMNLTEPDAGSDVGALRTKAEPVGDGSYKLFGTKIYISWGDHDMVDQIVHLVLARTPDSPPGTKGISLFLVPKFHVNDDGSLGDQNDVKCLSVEHKMGIRASPTCVLSFGENGDGAVGHLIGEEHQGMKAMFTMMNNARLSVANEGVGIAERAYQQALNYAQERVQGRAVGTAKGETNSIIAHADVRRMLMTMKARTEAMRALVFYEAAALDLSHFGPEADREGWGELADLLTPLAKSWCTDMVNDVTSTNIQIHGGMGYVEETGAAQHYRDARITGIYEGTNGIQAIDLVGRKLPMRGGAVVADLIARMRGTADKLEANGALADIGTYLSESLDAVESSTKWLAENSSSDINNALAGATPYQRMLSVVVGAWLMGESALGAQGLLDDGDADDDGFLAAKVVTARFFAEQLLPEAQSLVRAVAAGPDDLFAIPTEAMWFAG